MTLSQGRHYLAIPGPSVMPDRVLQAMHRPAPNIYTGELVEMVAGLIPDLKAVARMDAGEVAIYIANGHGAWEAALTNILSRGDEILVLGTGRFCQGWGEFAAGLGVQAHLIDFGGQADIDMARVSAALSKDPTHRIKAVLAVQVDTASSVRNDIQALRATLDQAGHPALLCVDTIACLACDAFHFSDWGVDVMVTASQKGLMTPPGLAFVAFSDKADRARASANCVTPYWDWRPRVNPQEFYRYFNGTAPTHHLYGLRVALDMILTEEGLPHVWNRHARLAQAVGAAVDIWGQSGPVACNIADPAKRSHAVTTVYAGAGNGARLRDWMTNNAGVTLGIPLGGIETADRALDDHFRIGHMGHVNAHMVLGVLGSLQAGMTALGIPHDATGLAAAASVIAQR